jgi:hypothetical protein
MVTKRRQRVEIQASNSSRQSRMIALLERIDQQNYVFAVETRIRDDLARRIHHLSARIDALELRGRKNSNDLERLRTQVERLTGLLNTDRDDLALPHFGSSYHNQPRTGCGR